MCILWKFLGASLWLLSGNERRLRLQSLPFEGAPVTLMTKVQTEENENHVSIMSKIFMKLLIPGAPGQCSSMSDA